MVTKSWSTGNRHLLPFILPLFLLSSCGLDDDLLPEMTGSAGEVVLVMDSTLWNGSPGDMARGVLEQYIPWLPQREPRFTVLHFERRGFGRLVYAHRNILICAIDPKLDRAQLTMQHDKWAKGQLVLQLRAPDRTALARTFQKRSVQIVDQFEQADLERMQAHLEKYHDANAVAFLAKDHQLSVLIPRDLKNVYNKEYVVRFQRDRILASSGLTHDVMDGILIYHYAYTSDSTFTREYQMNMRDSVLKLHVAGPDPGSYMMTQREFEGMDLRPETTTTLLNSQFTFVMHGLWGMVNAHMGGAFVSISQVDEARGRVVTVEGYVYAPQFDKREFVRDLEAIVRTLKVAP